MLLSSPSRSTIDKIILLMGFDEAAALIAKDYVWILVAINMVSGVNGTKVT